MEEGPVAIARIEAALKENKSTAQEDVLSILQLFPMERQKPFINKALLAHALKYRWENLLEYINRHFANDRKIQQKLAEVKATALHVPIDIVEYEFETPIPEDVNAFAQKHRFIREGEVFDFRFHQNEMGESLFFKAIAENNFTVAKWLDDNWPKATRRALLEQDEDFALQLKYWCFEQYQQEIMSLLKEHHVDVDILSTIQDKKLEAILVAALNSDKEADNFAARGLMMLGVRLPRIYKLTEAGLRKNNEYTTEIGALINNLIEENNTRKVQYQIEDVLTKNERQATTLIQLCDSLASKSPNETPIPSPPVNSLAFQGGGPRGACYNGVSEALEQLKVSQNVRYVAGSSAGAITALGFALGLDAKQFATLSGKLDFQDLLDKGGSYVGALWYNHIYSGQNFHDWASMLCLAVLGSPDATFGDLHQAITEPSHPYYNPSLKELIITGTQLLKDGTSQTIAFSSLDPATSEVKIADAVRASMSIPGVYQPWEVIDINEKNWGTFVDGGVLNNFPINLLDDPELTQTHLGIKYNLAPKKGKLGPAQVNPCSFGFTFADTLSNLKPKITPLTPHLLEQVKKDSVQLVDDSEVAPLAYKDVGVMKVAAQIFNAFQGQRNPENLAEKCEHHQGNVVQMFPEGIGLMDFNAPKEQIDRAAKTAKESTLLTFQKKSLSSQHEGKSKIKQLSLEEYLMLFLQEASKYQSKELEQIYKSKEMLNNVTLQFIAKQIKAALEKRPKNVSEEDYLALKIAECQKLLRQRHALIERANKRIDTVMDDQSYLNVVGQEIRNAETTTDKFKTLIDGQLTRVIELCAIQSNYHENANLLQLAASSGNYDALDYMLKKIKAAYQHRQEQKKATNPGEAFSDILNHVNGGVLAALVRANIPPTNKMLCLQRLKEHAELDTVAVNHAGLTPLHLAAKHNQPEVFLELMALVGDKYFYQKTFQTSPIEGHDLKDKETLFEYILRECSLEFINKIMCDVSIAQEKLFYSKHPVNNQFTMEQLFANYCKEKGDAWDGFYKAYWGGADANKKHFMVCQKGFDERAKILASKHEEIVKEKQRKDALYANFNKLFGVDLANSFDKHIVHKNINMKVLEEISAQDLLEMMSLSLQEESDANGLNILCYACKMGQFEAVDKIIEKLEKANLKGGILPLLTAKSREYAPLMWAIAHFDKHPDNALKIINLLMDKAVIGDYIHQAGSSADPCAITFCAKLGHHAAVETLFGKIVTRRTQDGDGRTLLHYLAMNPNTTPELFHKVMVGSPANWVYRFHELGLVDQYGKTPLHYLIDNNRQDILEYILTANIQRRGYSGISYEEAMTLDEAFDFSTQKDSKAKPFAHHLKLLEYAAVVNPDLAKFIALKIKNGLDLLQKAKERKVELLDKSEINAEPIFTEEKKPRRGHLSAYDLNRSEEGKKDKPAEKGDDEKEKKRNKLGGKY